MKKENLQSFIDEFEKVVSRTITTNQLVAEIEVDLEINIDEVDDKLYRIIKQFAPFGPKNRNPNFVSKNVTDCGWGKKVGEDKTHLRLVLNTSAEKITCIGFRMSHDFEKITNNKSFNIAGKLSLNEWKGQSNVEFIIDDISVNKTVKNKVPSSIG